MNLNRRVLDLELKWQRGRKRLREKPFERNGNEVDLKKWEHRMSAVYLKGRELDTRKQRITKGNDSREFLMRVN